MKKIILILFFVNCTLQIANAQWTQLPNLPVSGTVWDMYFANVNTGWVTLVTPTAIIKTTDGGQNWVTQSNISIRNIQFIDTALGYGQGFIGTNGTIWKTTNGGTNWNSVLSDGNSYADISFVNKDTGWVCGFDGVFGGVWRTTDAGNSFTRQYTSASNGLDKIFFLKYKVNGEYWGWTFKGTILFKTTNSGSNWFAIPAGINTCNTGGGVDMYFADTGKGVVTTQNSCFSVTANGGYNWTVYSEFNSLGSHIGAGNSSILWLTLGDTIIKTTNFFQTYGKQVSPAFSRIIFALDTSLVYAGFNQTNVLKTTNGGGNIVYVNTISSEIPDNFYLYQNYPNPFNPATKIEYQIPKNSYVILKVYDILGREVIVLVSKKQNAGTYEINWDASGFPSGLYFYTLETGNYRETKKMVYLA